MNRANFLLLTVTLATIAAAQNPGDVVISQVYGGGGNTGATLRNDFIEIFNRSSQPVSLNNWSVQYAATTGSNWTRTNLTNVNLQPGQYYLIQQAQGTGGTQNLPTPDATGTTAMSATAGKVALVNNQTTIAAGTVCPTGASIIDFVGFGTGTNCFEGTGPTPAPSNTAAVLRAGAGCTDTNVNSADFTAGTPNPRNIASPLNACTSGLTITTQSPLPGATVNNLYSLQLAASGGTGPYTWSVGGESTLPSFLTLTAGGLLSGTPTSTAGSPFNFSIQVMDSASATQVKSFDLTVSSAAGCAVTSTISEIQGSGSVSPFANNTIVTTSGTVTGRRSNGFYMQWAGDGNAATSDGLFVFTSSAPPAAAGIGNQVCVTGPVLEFRPSTDPASPTVTEISVPTSVTAISTGNTLPAAVMLTAADTNPAGGLDVLEKYEGMRVQIGTVLVTSPTGRLSFSETAGTLTSNGTFGAVINGVARPFREPGIQQPDPLPAGAPATVTRFDGNPELLTIESSVQGGTPLNVAAGQFVSNIVGPLDYRSRKYTVVQDATPAPTVSGTAAFTPVPAPGANQVTVAGFNMERFYDNVDSAGGDAVLTANTYNTRLAKVSMAIRNVLQTPDIVAAVEVEDLGVLQAIAAKVNADAGSASPNYVAYLVEGNDIGLIDVGFLVKSSRIDVLQVLQIGKTDTFVDPTDGSNDLLHDRPPLVLRALAGGLPVTVIANHLRSLNSIDDPVDGPRVRAKRRAQAEYVANYIQARQAANPSELIMTLGDFNAFQFSDGYVDLIGTIRGVPTPASQVTLASADLVNPDLTDLVETHAAPGQQYSYVFDGSAQVLDHILVNQPLLSRVSGFATARANADFPEIYRFDASRPERMSDHDMPVAYLTVPAAANVTSQCVLTGVGLTYNRFTRIFYGTFTVRNNSATAMTGPIQLMFTDLNAGVTVFNRSGSIGGVPFITSNTSLAPGQSVVIPIQFQTVGTTPITYVLKAFSGTL